MEVNMHPNVAGALINSAIYLCCVFVAGIMTANPAAWKLALVTMGAAFFSHVAQIAKRKGGEYLVAASWLFGAAAGVALVF